MHYITRVKLHTRRIPSGDEEDKKELVGRRRRRNRKRRKQQYLFGLGGKGVLLRLGPVGDGAQDFSAVGEVGVADGGDVQFVQDDCFFAQQPDVITSEGSCTKTFTACTRVNQYT